MQIFHTFLYATALGTTADSIEERCDQRIFPTNQAALPKEVRRGGVSPYFHYFSCVWKRTQENERSSRLKARGRKRESLRRYKS